jgi:hypothetical protein
MLPPPFRVDVVTLGFNPANSLLNFLIEQLGPNALSPMINHSIILELLANPHYSSMASPSLSKV